MRFYSVTVGGMEYQLRLTLSGQKKLKKKHPDTDTISLLMTAATDAEIMADVLHEALNWPGNTNQNQNGEQLYDLMVDDGICGQEAFAEIACGIGTASGLMTEENGQQVLTGIRKVVQTVYGKIGDLIADETDNPN